MRLYVIPAGTLRIDKGAAAAVEALRAANEAAHSQST